MTRPTFEKQNRKEPFQGFYRQRRLGALDPSGVEIGGRNPWAKALIGSASYFIISEKVDNKNPLTPFGKG
jgi:hypothetical protein